jgi:hypothetical protein
MISVSPVPGAFSAPADSAIQASFSEPVASQSLTPDSFRVHGSLSGTIPGTFGGGGTSTVTFFPSSAFLPGERVTVTITDTLSAVSGNELSPTYTWQFTVSASAGPGSFSISQVLAATAYSSVSVGDLNRDGYVDAVLSKNGQNEIWLNQGDGTLSLYWTAPEADETRRTVLFDLDNDGDLDIYVANKGNDFIWLNHDNASSFNNNQTFSFNDSTAAVASDFDNDGFIDIYVTRYGNSDVLLMNDGNGALQATGAIPGASTNSNGAVIADFNNDGLLDVFTAIQGYNQVLLNEGSAVFTPGWTSPNSRISYALDTGDFNSDDNMDVLVANGNTPNEIWLGNGDGTFADSGQSLGGNIWTADIAAADFNGDGLPDVYQANGIVPGPDQVLFSDSGGNLVDSGAVFDSKISTAVATADFNNDGFVDFLVTSSDGAELWLNLTEGINITSPVSSSTWFIGDTELLTWTSFGFDGAVAIEISRDGGNTWVSIGADVDNTGTFEWTVDEPESPTVRFRITSVTDQSMTAVSEQFTILFPDPVAMNDSYQTEQDTELAVPSDQGVLVNDTFGGSMDLSASLVTGPENGSLEIYPNGSFIYIPDVGYFGNDSFSYSASAGVQVSNIASVEITVIGHTNVPPMAVDDTFVTQKNQTLAISENEGVLANDADEESESLSASLITDVTNGELNFQSDGSFQYIPAEGFSGIDSFVYKANDGTDDSNPATVTIMVEDNSPKITAEPTDILIVYGETGQFTSEAIGVPAPSIQWQQSLDHGQTWIDIPGAVDGTLTLSQADVSWTGRQYRSVFTNEHGSTASSAARLTVSARTVVVTADPVNKTYGEDDPVLSFQISVGSLVAGDAFDGEPGREPGEDTGEYVIYQGSLSLSSNYELTFKGSTLTILPKPASATPDNISKYEGEPDPVLTGTLNGFLENDGITAEYSREPGEGLGQYQIQVILTPADKLTNYQVTLNTGVFSIVDNPYPQIVEQPDDQTIIYGNDAVFTIVAEGNPAPEVVWQTSDDGIEWQSVIDGTGHVFTVRTPEVAIDGRRYRAVVTNEFGEIYSRIVTLNVVPRAVAPIVTVAEKVYDENTTAHINFRALSGLIDGDDVYLVGGNAVFATRDTGNDIAVTITGLSIAGNDAFNYVLTTTGYQTQANILPPVFDGGLFQKTRLTAVNLAGSLPYLSAENTTTAFGYVTTRNGALTIEIQSGTWLGGLAGGDIHLSVTPVSTPAPPQNSTLILAYDFGPPGLVFDPGINLSWHYDASTLPPGVTPADLIAVYFEGNTWIELPGSLDEVNRTITVQIDHFSTYGLMAVLPEKTDDIPELPDAEQEKPAEIPEKTLLPISEGDDDTPGKFEGRYLISAFVGAMLAGGAVLLFTRRADSY